MENERLAVVEAQVKWIAPIVERTEMKLDRLLESHLSFKWKIVGISSTIGFLASLLVELIRR